MRRLAGALSVLFVAFAGLGAVSVPVASGAPNGDSAAYHRVQDYWTQARRAAAKPRDVMRGKPPGGGGGGGSVVTGATWTGGGDVVLTTGKVFFSMDGGNWVCSGSVVDTTIGAVVLTAGHCVNGGPGAFATNFLFVPAYDNGSRPLGDWVATDLFTTTTWAAAGDFDDDAGFAVVQKPGAASLEAAIQAAGGNDVVIPTFEAGPASPYSAFGYPAAKKYNGQVLTYCAGPAVVGYDGEATQSIACNMTGGSSGGPWLEGFPAAPKVSSLNSYGYSGLNRMFGPVFDGPEQSAFGGAGTGDCPVAPSTYRCVDYN